MNDFRVVAIVCAAVCGCSVAPAPRFENAFKFQEPGQQKLFAELLKKEGVPFRRTRDDTLLYDARDEARVNTISRLVIEAAVAQ